MAFNLFAYLTASKATVDGTRYDAISDFYQDETGIWARNLTETDRRALTAGTHWPFNL